MKISRKAKAITNRGLINVRARRKVFRRFVPSLLADGPEVIAKDEIFFCSCMGPMYGEPHCHCTMEHLGLPRSPQWEIERVRAEVELTRLFEPEGTYCNGNK